MANYIARQLLTAFILTVIAVCNISCSTPTQIEPTTNNTHTDNNLTIINDGNIAPKIGYFASDFTLPNLDDEKVSLRNLKGKIVMLAFWVIDCKGCREELPFIDEFFHTPNTNIAVFTVCVGDTANTVLEFLKSHQYSFPVLIDESGDVCIRYEHGAPTTFLIGKDGIIMDIKEDSFQSYQEIETFISTANNH
jgi:peroxiredoxin